ncbi:MAG TPA: PDZ domain-containing protein [Planctomycetota bacterium]|nr:PDZ domain-containing protein [Planctomycetota bacterium]
MRRAQLVVLTVLAGCFAAGTLCGQSRLKQLNDELVQIAGKLTPSVVAIELPAPPGPRVIRRQGGEHGAQWHVEVHVDGGDVPGAIITGSGVIMSADGFILTSAKHFQDDKEARPKVKLADGRTFDGKLTGLDRRTGLAVVKIEAQHLPAVALAEKALPVGSLVLAASNTAGLGPSVSLGMVSGTGRVVEGEGPAVLGSATQYTGMLQVTNPVGASDAGGLAADLDGNMVGMLHSSMTGRPRMPQAVGGGDFGGVRIFGLGPVGPPTVQGVSFVTPADVIRRVYEPLRRGEKVEWGYLGVYFAVTRGQGLRVTKVVPDGPAAAAGLREGDVLLSLTVPGRETIKLTGEADEVAHFARYIGWARPGTEVTLGVRREGRDEQLKVTLGTAPEVPQEEVQLFDPRVMPHFEGGERMGRDERAWLGIQLEGADGGVRISAVIPGSPAERHGLHVGDVILRIGEEATETTARVTQEVEKRKPGQRISITVRRGDGQIVADVELGRRPGQPFQKFLVFAQAQLGIEAEDTAAGLRVTRVFEGSAAEKAGLRVDDILVRADDRDLAGLGDLKEILRRHRVDDEITLTVRRDDKEMDFKVKLKGRELPQINRQP